MDAIITRKYELSFALRSTESLKEGCLEIAILRSTMFQRTASEVLSIIKRKAKCIRTKRNFILVAHVSFDNSKVYTIEGREHPNSDAKFKE